MGIHIIIFLLTPLPRVQDMGIKLVTMADGRVQLLHTANDALSPAHAEQGLLFMQEMIELSKQQPQESKITFILAFWYWEVITRV